MNLIFVCIEMNNKNQHDLEHFFNNISKNMPSYNYSIQKEYPIVYFIYDIDTLLKIYNIIIKMTLCKEQM